jgi:hypothetical protein
MWINLGKISSVALTPAFKKFKNHLKPVYTHIFTLISTVIHTFSTPGGKAVKTDNPQSVIQKVWLRARALVGLL